jgi:hypothetical protein
METVGPRTYKVKRNECPLSIMIAPKNTTGNAATTVIVGHIREVKNGVELDERDVDVDDREGILTYDIAAPHDAGRIDVVQTLLGFFATAEKDNARFAITIQSAQGATVSTAIRVPTFNPAAATLRFQVQA